jgi:hypothetical protein
MRDYTYFQGARFAISNIYRSERFDVDRLDLSLVDEDRPEFCRGLRVIDHQVGHTEMVDGDEADSLIYSLAYLSTRDTTKGSEIYDEYLVNALKTREFSISNHEKLEGIKPKEDLLH